MGDEHIEKRIKNCKNFSSELLCDHWIIESYSWVSESDEDGKTLSSGDSEKAKEICNSCKHFSAEHEK